MAVGVVPFLTLTLTLKLVVPWSAKMGLERCIRALLKFAMVQPQDTQRPGKTIRMGGDIKFGANSHVLECKGADAVQYGTCTLPGMMFWNSYPEASVL